MICLDEGILRAYLDEALTKYEMLSVKRHLSLCDDCHNRHEKIMARTQTVSALFADLSPLPQELRTDDFAAQCAFTRFKANYDVDFDAITPPIFVPAFARELYLLLPEETLCRRLRQAWQANWQDFKRNPQGFISYLLRGEGVNPVRRRGLQTGTAVAMVSYALVFTTLIIAGVLRSNQRVSELPSEKFTIVKLATPPPTKSKPLSPPEFVKAGQGGVTGGNKIQSEPAHGGGGGGKQELTPVTNGRAPQFSPNPQLLPPRPQPARIDRPLLLTPETLVGDKYLLDVRGRTGLPDAADAAPSSGSGRNAGMGAGQGTGLGDGDGKGLGPGFLNNKGNGPAQTGGGLSNSDNLGTGAEVFDATNSLKPTFLSREKAKYTDEAQLNRVQGTVLLSAVFGADGHVHDIRIVRGLSHGLSESAIATVKKIKFVPARKNGVPVNVRMTLQYDFSLF